MKKKLLLLVTLLVLVFSFKTFVFADETEYTTAVCTDDESGSVHIRWDKQKEHVGAVYVCYYPVISRYDTVTGEYDTEEEAQAAIEEIQGEYVIPHCCHTTDVKESACSGDVCKVPVCTITPNKRTYTPTLSSATIFAGGSVTLSVNGMPPNCSVSSWTGATNGVFTSSTAGTYSVSARLSCGITLSATVTVMDPVSGQNTTAAYNSYTTKNSIKTTEQVTSSGGSVTVITSYTISCKVPHVTYDKTKCVPGDKEIISLSYEINLKDDKYEGDSVYCLQPGASGPGPDDTGLPYIEDMNFDISQCQDQFTNKSDKNAVQCGLAQILYQTYNCDRSTGKCTPKGEYSNGVITMALRLWMAAYGKDTYPLGTTNPDEDNPLLDWIPREDYYEVTAKLIKNGKCYNTSYAALQRDKVEGRIGCTKSEGGVDENKCTSVCDIDKAIELFHQAENVKKEDYLGGINFDKKVPVFKQDIDQGIIKVEFDKVEDVIEINQDCKPGDPGCTLSVRFYYGDIDVTDLIDLGEWSCEKNTCVAKITGSRLCLQYNTPGVTIVRAVLEISNWQRNNGYVRFYTHATSPNKYQKMISFGLELEKCEEENEKEKSLYIPGEVRIDCPCGPEKCNDLNVKESPDGECIGTKEINDPNMNCIVNACFQNETYQYNVTSKYIVNPLVCTLYERQDNKFYLPEKTSVYAGMQFSYDLGTTRGIKTISDNMDSSQKLTSIVIQKKQVTSKINYSFWKSEYDRKLDRLSYAYDQGYPDEYKKSLKAEIDEWIFDLKNCNLYTPTQTGASVTRSHAITNIISSASCTGDSCLKMAISYEDLKYGDKKELTDYNKVVTNQGYELYYCKNDGNARCYKYEEDNPVEIKEKNKTALVSYYKNGKIEVPANDYATIVLDIEHDFYSATKYKTKAYTGAVEEGEITKEESKSYTALSENSYPVSSGSKTGEYKVKIDVNNIGNLGRKSKTYDYTCKYQVYNRTTAYDCAAVDSKGNIDLSKCEDTNYKVENGVPIISDRQISWQQADSKNNGFVFKNVDLSNLFPNGLDNLNSSVNWTDRETEIKEIESTADSIFTNETYLEYSYTITPQGMKEIKNYNSNHLVDGGYLNSTLVDCTLEDDETGLKQFNKCKSTFLEEIRGYAGVTVNKDGEVR